MSKVQPLILGSGQAGKALAAACKILSGTEKWRGQLLEPRFLERGTALTREGLAKASGEEPLLLLANPQGLHAASLLEAVRGGIRRICVEKPGAVRLSEVAELGTVTRPVAVFHGYRQMWGAQKVREMVGAGELGEIFAVDVRYWQSSAAARALTGETSKSSWKDDLALLGPYDTYLDLGCHAVDLVQHVIGVTPANWTAQIMYPNAEAGHRDTHAHVDGLTDKGASIRISLSKTVHGFGNELDLTVCGTKGSGRWRFQDPDHVVIGVGQNQKVIYRAKSEGVASEFPPGHGIGWLEGYVATIEGYLEWVEQGRKPAHLPSLEEHLITIKGLLNANISIPRSFAL